VQVDMRRGDLGHGELAIVGWRGTAERSPPHTRSPLQTGAFLESKAHRPGVLRTWSVVGSHPAIYGRTRGCRAGAVQRGAAPLIPTRAAIPVVVHGNVTDPATGTDPCAIARRMRAGRVGRTAGCFRCVYCTGANADTDAEAAPVAAAEAAGALPLSRGGASTGTGARIPP
jgi:hypothetical protein